MTFPIIWEHLMKGLVVVFASLFLLICGMLVGYSPILGVLFPLCLGLVFAYYYHPPWFAFAFVLTVSFGALLNIPITQGGFSSAVAIAFFSFLLGFFGALMNKDHHLLAIFVDRVDQILPLLFFVLMIISLINSQNFGLAAKQLQQFFYLVVIYYFLHLTIRNRETFQKAVLVLFLGGICVGLLGLVEVFVGAPIYFLLGNKSLLGASVADALLNAKRGRINGVIGDAPFHGIYMTIMVLLSAYFFFRSRRFLGRSFAVLVFLLSMFNTLGTGSRGAFLSLLVGLFIFWAAAEIPHKRLIMLSTITMGVVFVLGSMALAPQIDFMRSFSYEEDSAQTARMRLENIPVALRMFEAHPLIGNGPDGFVINYRRYASGLTNLAYREKTLQTHNTPLQILAEYGLAGCVVFGLIIFMTLKRLVYVTKNKTVAEDGLMAHTLIAGIAAYLLFMSTSNSLLDKYFWILIALGEIHYSIVTSPGARKSV